MASKESDGVEALAELSALLATSTHQFLQPTPHLREIAINAAKATLDPLADAIANLQADRRSENRRKRKRRAEDEDEGPVLHLRQIHTDGFGPNQVWEQARRILDAACYEVDRQAQLNSERLKLRTSNGSITGDDTFDVEPNFDARHREATEVDSDAFSEEDDHLEDDDVDSAEDVNDMGNPDDVEDIEVDSDIEASSDDDFVSVQETFVPDPNGLNDGFFSIDNFNKQSQFLEQMDARGDDDNPSDEDEIDWDADPLAEPAQSGTKPISSMKGRKNLHASDEDESDAEDDGPIFGDADLLASDDEDDMALDGEDNLEEGMGLSNANDIRYADFFEPPPKKLSKTKRMRALPKTQPQLQEKKKADESQVQNDLERAIADVRRDLLDSGDEEDDEEDLDDDEGLSNDEMLPKVKSSVKNMSTHEKQKAAIAAEIRRLEAANVAKRDWQLSGEARAADRPLNSLIEEDLEFERAGKPVPVVTAETSEEIEQLIKRRILAREFDEVIRRSAAGIGSAGDTRRGRVEVDDSKPQASLGEIYEQEHLKTTDPTSYVDKRSAATKKQHEQIDVLWREVNDQLNLLSNLHFKPKRIDIELKMVEDKPRIALEDARPVGEIESGEGGMLAPQEVYKPGTSGTTTEITQKSGASLNREEMTREEKLRRRRREKERSKKAQGNKAQIVLGRDGNANAKQASQRSKKIRGNKEQEKADIIADLKRGNVQVVGKDGQLQNMGKSKKGGQRDDEKNVQSIANLRL